MCHETGKPATLESLVQGAELELEVIIRADDICTSVYQKCSSKFNLLGISEEQMLLIGEHSHKAQLWP